MRELWHGADWSEEDEQRDEDHRAVRIITCRRKGCRRRRLCQAHDPFRDKRRTLRCFGRRWPQTEAEEGRHYRALLHMLKVDVAENEADPEAYRIATAARKVTKARRQALAWERAKERLRAWVAAGCPEG
jgi:hypothetical protein